MTPSPPFARTQQPLGGSKWAAMFAGPPAGLPNARRLLTHKKALCHPDGSVTAAHHSSPPDPRCIFLMAAGPLVPLGQFLCGSLPAILASGPLRGGAIPAGGLLTPTQQNLLLRLGLSDAYITLDRPTCFTRILQSTQDSPGDEPFLQMIARLRCPPASHLPATVAILPDPATARFSLSNRHSLVTWLRARRCRILTPDTAALDDTIAGLAGATRMIIADPAQAGVLGLCQPGAQILEIAAEGWADHRVRVACRALGLDWHLFLATAPSYPLLRPPPLGTLSALSFEIPIASIALALASL